MGTDADLIRLLHERHGAVLWAVALRTTADPGRAQDAVQETLVRAWRHVDALARLSPEHRAVLAECYYRGRSVREAATVLGVPPGTVKSRTHYALRALRLVLEEMGVGE